MSRFLNVPFPVFSPTRCIVCHSSRDPGGFVDLMVDDIPVDGWDENGIPVPSADRAEYGHAYECASCADQITTVNGGLDRSERARLEHRLAEAEAENEALKAALEQERSKVERLVEYLQAGQTEQPKPEPAPKPRRAKTPAA